MSKLIDGDALIETITARMGYQLEHAKNRPYVDCARDMMKLVKHAPTIDAVKVVRCEDCQYWQPPTYAEQEDGSTVGHCTAALNGQQTDAYWFCADGTR